MIEPKSAKQQEADAIVARSVKPDGTIEGLDNPNNWAIEAHWPTIDGSVFLDGYYSAEVLIAIGNYMLAHAKARRSET